VTLVDKGWIKATSGARRQSTNWIEDIAWDKLPAYVPMPKLVISAFAEKMAEVYKANFVAVFSKYVNCRGHHCTKKLPPNWKKRWSAVFQLRLNHGYTEQELTDRFNAVIQERSLHKALKMGPQNRKLFPIKKEAR
jgi:hypothetical protein